MRCLGLVEGPAYGPVEEMKKEEKSARGLLEKCVTQVTSDGNDICRKCLPVLSCLCAII